MTDYVKAWQCIGCGKIEAPQPCIGVCEDRKVQFVYAYEYEEALAQTQRAQQAAQSIATVLRRMASTTPRDGEWERSYRALQQQARQALAAFAEGAAEDRGSERR
ncbi:MAG: hypothetical protein IT521_01860 [Burkholderiales bacterium]|nr:hypothetical protein [Burkholderiales bacterium]